MAWLDGLKVGTINGVPTPCRISVSQGSPYYLEPGGKAYPLPYDFSVTCVGLVGDQGLYLLNAGGFRLVDLTDIVEAEPLGTDPTERTKLQRIATAVDGVLQGARTIKRIAEE